MKFVFYFFIIVQILNFLGVFAEKVTKESSEFNPIKWEKVRENEEKPLKKIIWKSYKEDKSYFEKTNLKNKSKENLDKALGETSTWNNRSLRFSFEKLNMPDGDEHMGLYSIGSYNQLKPWLYGGISLYIAPAGSRGDFFSGGYTLGVERILLDKLIFDAGGYVGAGVGGPAEHELGLMIRSHVGLKYKFSWSELGLNYTYVEFLNGYISSDAIALTLDIPFN